MASKEILSIQQFKVSDKQAKNQLYPRSFALPQFFTMNLQHDARVVKVFTGQNAILKAFYFNYMKLTFQSKNSEQYRSLLKEMFIDQENIQAGQLEDKNLSDFQYRKFFKDFIDKSKQTPTPEFQYLANKYPIIDAILQKLFKTIVPITLFLPDEDSKQLTQFEMTIQVINYLCEHFQEEYIVQIPGKCIKFQASQIYLYVESIEQVYLAFIDQSSDKSDKLDEFESSSSSSFVCGEGNSFTSKFKLTNNLHETNKNQRKSSRDNQKMQKMNKNSLNIKKTDSEYLNKSLSEKLQKQLKQQRLLGTQKSSLLQSKGSLIRRRSRNSQIKPKSQIKPNSQIDFRQTNEIGQKSHQQMINHQPVSCYQYESEQILQQQESKNYSPIESIAKQEQKANTLINILDSRVSEFDQINQSHNNQLTIFQTNHEKGNLIMRRRENRSNVLSYQNQVDDSKLLFERLQIQSRFQDNQLSLKQQKERYHAKNVIFLPQPSSSSQVSQVQRQRAKPSYNYLNTKHYLNGIQEIMQLGQDQDSQNTIKDFCQVQFIKINNQSQQYLNHSYKNVNLTDQISHKLMIQRVQSRNIDISRTSIGQSLSSPNKLEKYSFFDKQNERQSEEDKEYVYQSIKTDSNDDRNYNNEGQTIQNKKINYNPNEVNDQVYDGNFQMKKSISFQQYMKQMKQKLPFNQKLNFHNSKVNNNSSCLSPSLTSNNQISVRYNFQKSVNKNSRVVQNKQNDQKVSSSVIRNTKVGFSPISNDQQKSKQMGEQKSGQFLIKSKQSLQLSNGNTTDEFTRSDILLLLDQQYRDKIRAIKNDFKSTIKEQPVVRSILHKKSIISVQNNQKLNLNQNVVDKDKEGQLSNERSNLSMISQKKSRQRQRQNNRSRERETSIYVHEDNNRAYI